MNGRPQIAANNCFRTARLGYMARTPAAGYAASAVLGIAQGTYFGAVQPLWARYFGRRHLGQIRGVLMTINVAAASLGPLFAGLTRDATGDFGLALLSFAWLPLPVAVMCLLVASPGQVPVTSPPDAAPAIAR